MNSPFLKHIRGLFNEAKPGLDGPISVARPGVHPTAVLDGDIELEDGATVGPYCVLTGRIKIGARTRVLAHSVIEGTALIGSDCVLGPHAAVGTRPQHRGYDGRETYLVVEDGVTAREFASIHRATKPGLENATRVGRGSFVMAGAHVAHDCRVGENVTLANAVLLGGHVTVGDTAFVGGGALVHQFCRVGRLAVVGGGEIVVKDVLPFGAMRGGGHRAYNAVGVRRAGWPADAVRDLRSGFHALHARRSITRAAEALREERGEAVSSEVREILDFIAASDRGVHASVAWDRAGAKADAAGED